MKLHIVTLCRLLPTPDAPTQGVFVQRRLEGMAKSAKQVALQPVPYFPLLRPRPNWVGLRSEQGALSIHPLPMFYLPGILKGLDAHWMVRSLIHEITKLHKQHPIDILDAHWGYPEAVACQSISQTLGIPYSVTLRGHEEDYLQIPEYRERLLSAFRDAAVCICVSHSLAELIIDAGIDSNKVHVVHNALDRSTFQPGPMDRARKRLGLAEDQTIVLSVGNLLPVKKHELLISAFDQLRSKHPNSHLLIAGSTSSDRKYTEQLRMLVQRSQLEKAVTFLGSVNVADLVDYYQAADVFSLLSAREGCCNAILEALACGLPVVASPAGDNGYFVNSTNGAIVPHEDPTAAAEALDHLIRRRPGVEQTSANLNLGSWPEIGEQITHIFRNAI